MVFIDLELHRFQDDLLLKRQGRQVFVFDPLRKRYLLLSPEEWVRQLLIRYLLHRAYPAGRLAVEQSLVVNGRTRRFDLLAYNAQGQPFLLVECKAPEVNISQKAMDQIAAYNHALKAPYLLLTNGRQTLCCAMTYEENATSLIFLDSIPAP